MTSFGGIIGTVVLAYLFFVFAEAFRRLVLHPLAGVPGPKLAGLTWWYEFYFDVLNPGQFVFRIQELHRRYGPIVRITPDELHISDAGFLDTIYPPLSGNRNKYPYQMRGLRFQGSIGATDLYDLHKRRRESLSPFFSKRNVLHLEPLIARKVEQLCGMVSRHANDNTPVNLSDLFFAFANDVVKNFLFAQQTDILAKEDEAAVLRHNSNQLLRGVHRNKHLPWIPTIISLLPASVRKPITPPAVKDLMELRNKAEAEVKSIMQAKASGVPRSKTPAANSKESVYESVLDSTALPAEDKTLVRLTNEGALLTLAGTESPAKTLGVIFYHLLANTSTMLPRLREELAQTSATPRWTELEQLPYLSAVIEEGNRLSFGVTNRMVRIAHEPLVYAPTEYAKTLSGSPQPSRTYVIPAHTPVSITTLATHTNEIIFPDPWKFNPDRWIGIEGKERRKFQQAFSKGGRRCLGIELARAELYLLTAALLKKFDLSLWHTDESPVAFHHDFQVAMPKLESKGLRVMVSLRKP